MHNSRFTSTRIHNVSQRGTSLWCTHRTRKSRSFRTKVQLKYLTCLMFNTKLIFVFDKWAVPIIGADLHLMIFWKMILLHCFNKSELFR